MMKSPLLVFLFIVGVTLGLGGVSRAAAAEDPAPALLATINGVIDLALGQSPDAITAKLPRIRDKMSETFGVEANSHRPRFSQSGT
jgi:hypothetical protein